MKHPLTVIALVLALCFAGNVYAEEDTIGDTLSFVESMLLPIYYNRYEIDTSGVEPTIRVAIETDGRTHQLDSAGIIVESDRGNTKIVTVPIRMIREIAELETVISFRYGEPALLFDTQIPTDMNKANEGSSSGRSGTGPISIQNSEMNEKDSKPDDIDRFIRRNYSKFAIDTTGPEPRIAITITTDGRFYQLDSLGIATGSQNGSRNGDLLNTWVPIRLLSSIRSLESVISVRYSQRTVYHHIKHEINTEPGTGVVSGILTDMLPCPNKKSELIIVPAPEVYGESGIPAPVNYRNRATVTSTDRFRLTNIAEGSYYAIIRSYCSDSLMPERRQSDSALVGDVIIANLTVKPGFISLISKKDVVPSTERGRNHYVWSEHFRELEKQE
jgi:hypothetical protein